MQQTKHEADSQGGPALALRPGTAELSGRDLGARLVDENAAHPVSVLRLGQDLDVPVIVVADRGPVSL